MPPAAASRRAEEDLPWGFCGWQWGSNHPENVLRVAVDYQTTRRSFRGYFSTRRSFCGCR
ncbi:hypothetical protein ATOP_00410 [Granulimonas faecalis]|uniref:Uncharacterized protein n=1 Tax=Granulimonas faecalis TaxID=2894155 RepID=A0AAV5B177_9ACTN|nr:hypothetical protein ATOP_00410 [Granulimonas faecalis]